MFEGLNPWQNARNFIDEYGAIATGTVITDIGKFDQTNRSLNHLDRLFGFRLNPLLEKLNERGAFSVLDVPCGSNAIAASMIVSGFENALVSAVDIKLGTIDYPVNPRLSLIETDLLKDSALPLRNADLVICYGFMCYLREARRDDLIKEVLLKISDSLAPGGVALVDTAWDHLAELRDSKGRFFSFLIETEAQVTITKASRKLPILVQYPPKFGYRRRCDNYYALISKS